jgi:hypothetical protein
VIVVDGHLEEPVEESSEKGKDLESRMEQASLIKEKDSRILEPEAVGRTRVWRCAMLKPDLDQEKMEAEIQCIILARPSQTWTPLAENRKALYEEQKHRLGD